MKKSEALKELNNKWYSKETVVLIRKKAKSLERNGIYKITVKKRPLPLRDNPSYFDGCIVQLKHWQRMGIRVHILATGPNYQLQPNKKVFPRVREMAMRTIIYFYFVSLEFQRIHLEDLPLYIDSATDKMEQLLKELT